MLKNITLLDTWIKISEIYDKSKPKKQLQNHIITANLASNILFVGILTAPGLLGLLMLENQYLHLWMASGLVLYLILFTLFSDQIIMANHSNKTIYNLPILQRYKYLHYSNFKADCDSIGFINLENMVILLEWHQQIMTTMKLYKRREQKIHAFLTMFLKEIKAREQQYKNPNQQITKKKDDKK